MIEKEIINEIEGIKLKLKLLIQDDLRTGVSWLTNLRMALGNLDVASQILTKRILRQSGNILHQEVDKDGTTRNL